MTDPTQQLLTLTADTCSTSSRVLWIMDDNPCDTAQLAQLAARVSSLTVLTNRYDKASQASALGLDTRFSHFDFSSFQDTEKFDVIAFRISKERLVTHHVLNGALFRLATHGTLCLCGKKNEGAKGYYSTLNKSGCTVHTNKQGDNYTATVSRAADSPAVGLKDDNFGELRQVGEYLGQAFYSQPGVYGWKKQDAGTDLLLNTFMALPDEAKRGRSLLDLGCGSGYLVLAGAEAGCAPLFATDNNAGAVAATAHNLQQRAINGTAVASDCGDVFSNPFDLLLCNPPFHQGFDVSPALSRKFLAEAARLTSIQGGLALFVVNRFIPLETLAREWFKDISVVAADRSFKVCALAHQELRIAHPWLPTYS